ncbi:MAG: class B sortase [Oscillospiraceae bacterium]|nr:class B sortase [Oscillospiraceae bacterium]
MDREPRRYKESEDALHALEEVFAAAPKRRKKNFLQRNFVPVRGDSKKEKLRKAMVNFCLFVIFVCILVLLWYFVIDKWVSAPPPPPESRTESYTTPEGSTEIREIRVIDWAGLKALNPEVVCWLKIPGAKVDLPIVQTLDNVYYLKRDFKCKPSRYGNPFMDWRNKLEPMDTNLIIYGHHMKDGTIFGRLKEYEKRDVVANNPIITLETPEATYYYKVIAVLNVNGAPGEDRNYVFHFDTPRIPKKEDFDGFVKQLRQRTLINTGVDVQYGDHLLSVQTCLYDFKDEFLVLVARRVREGEGLEIDTNLVQKNPNPRYPQAWYDRFNGGRNPFRDAELWYPPAQ